MGPRRRPAMVRSPWPTSLRRKQPGSTRRRVLRPSCSRAPNSCFTSPNRPNPPNPRGTNPCGLVASFSEPRPQPRARACFPEPDVPTAPTRWSSRLFLRGAADGLNLVVPQADAGLLRAPSKPTDPERPAPSISAMDSSGYTRVWLRCCRSTDRASWRSCTPQGARTPVPFSLRRPGLHGAGRSGQQIGDPGLAQSCTRCDLSGSDERLQA